MSWGTRTPGCWRGSWCQYSAPLGLLNTMCAGEWFWPQDSLGSWTGHGTAWGWWLTVSSKCRTAPSLSLTGLKTVLGLRTVTLQIRVGAAPQWHNWDWRNFIPYPKHCISCQTPCISGMAGDAMFGMGHKNPPTPIMPCQDPDTKKSFYQLFYCLEKQIFHTLQRLLKQNSLNNVPWGSQLCFNSSVKLEVGSGRQCCLTES